MEHENYRVSSHTIVIPLEQSQDQSMLIHGYTGAIDVVHTSVGDFLRTQRTDFTRQACPFSEQTLNVLLARGYLTTKTKTEETAWVLKVADVLHRRNLKYSPGFHFVVTYNCNFRCPYCYEGGISGEGQKWSQQVFSQDMADRAYEAMLEIYPDRAMHGKSITLYGGEPLMAQNRDIVEYIVRKGLQLGYKFNAVTNGYDLDQFRPLLGPDKIKKVQITLDGMRENHDQRRIHYQQGRSFDKIVENIGLALSQGTAVHIRINTDGKNFNDLKKLQQLFAEQGFSSHKSFYAYAALLEQYDSPNEKQYRYLSPVEFNGKFQQAGLTIKCQDSFIEKKLSLAIQNKRSINLNSVFCSMQANSYLFDPYGKIYGCFETVGKPEYQLGNFAPAEIEWYPEQQKWHELYIGTNPQCSKCKYAFLCGGGCAAKKLCRPDIGTASYCSSFVGKLALAANQAYKTHMCAMFQ